jgi:methylmalonyl-CoA decarboxylase subunit alpha
MWIAVCQTITGGEGIGKPEITSPPEFPSRILLVKPGAEWRYYLHEMIREGSMSWDKEVRELETRRAIAAEMGGPEGVARQRKRGKLTVRERIAAISDEGSFREFMGLMGAGRYENNTFRDFLPRPLVEGVAKFDGRKVVITAGDFTVRGGSGGTRGGIGQELSASQRALEWRLPYIRLLDAAGGSVRSFEELGRTYTPDGNAWVQYEVQLLSTVPVVSAVLGSVAGLPAVQAPLSHFSIMVKNMSQIFPGGPPVVKAALGYDITRKTWAATTSMCGKVAALIISPKTRKTRSGKSAPS